MTKEGAYDLGRKSVYYVVVIIIVAVLFVYTSSQFRNFQVTKLSNLNEATDLVIVNNVVKCLSEKDAKTGQVNLGVIDDDKLGKDSLEKCLGTDIPYSQKAIKVKIKGREFETTSFSRSASEYEKIITYQGSDTTMKISIEKYPDLEK